MSVLEPFAQDMAAQLGNEASYKIVATIYKGEIAVVTVLGTVGHDSQPRDLGCDMACYSPGADESETDQINDLVELTRELMAATKNPPQGDVALAELGAHVHTQGELYEAVQRMAANHPDGKALLDRLLGDETGEEK